MRRTHATVSRSEGRYQRRGASERLAMVQRFHQSGLSRKEFAEQEGVPRSTLDWWLYVARHRTPESSLVFREVKVSLPATTGSSGWAMEIEAGGVTVRCREALSAPELNRLLRGGQC